MEQTSDLKPQRAYWDLQLQGLQRDKSRRSARWGRMAIQKAEIDHLVGIGSHSLVQEQQLIKGLGGVG